VASSRKNAHVLAPPSECGVPRHADVVVVGAGAAGAVVAARLSEARAAQVLLVEAGLDYRSAHTPPAVRGTDVARVLAMGSLRWPRLRARLTADQPVRAYASGRGVGGGSAINGQLAVRGTPADFEAWVEAGCSGWSWADVRPTFVHIEQDADFGTHPGHGTTGPVPICRAPARRHGPLSAALATAATGLGHAEHPDVNAEGSTGVSPTAWHRRHGTRVSSNDSYLEPARGRLRVAGEHTAARVLFASGRVRGLELVASGHREVVSTSAIVLCAGAVYSPAILLRSGIGAPGPLRALGIATVAALPGVGAGLIDHPAVVLDLRLTEAAAALALETESGSCLLRTRSRPTQWSPGTARPVDDLQILPMDRTLGPAAAGLMVSLMRPESAGQLRLRTADATADPVVDLGLLTDPRDVDRLGDAVRQAEELLDHRALRAIVQDRPTVPSGDLGPWLRAHCQAQYHPSGTCRMGPTHEPRTVVDEEGRVLGVEGLWVADGSVMPVPVGVPPYLSTVMVAERLAVAIQRRLQPAL
jgi:choline dehydrogenase-like flavoprotein